MSTLDEIKARVEAVTPGPWEVIEDEQTVRTEDGEIMFDRSGDGWTDWNRCGRDDAEFIAHARTDVPKLIAALEAVEAALAGLDEVFNDNSADDQAIRAIAITLRNLITEALQ